MGELIIDVSSPADLDRVARSQPVSGNGSVEHPRSIQTGKIDEISGVALEDDFGVLPRDATREDLDVRISASPDQDARCEHEQSTSMGPVHGPKHLEPQSHVSECSKVQGDVAGFVQEHHRLKSAPEGEKYLYHDN
jgi:hypothetical protein